MYNDSMVIHKIPLISMPGDQGRGDWGTKTALTNPGSGRHSLKIVRLAQKLIS